MSLEPQLKLAVLEDNRFLFGDTEMRLLDAIGRQGTLMEGAATLGLSYRVAWGKLRDLEAATGARLVERTAGGAQGGSSRLTEAGRDLVERYRSYRETIGDFVLREFQRVFGTVGEQEKLVGVSQRRSEAAASTMAPTIADTESDLAGESQ